MLIRLCFSTPGALEGGVHVRSPRAITTLCGSRAPSGAWQPAIDLEGEEGLPDAILPYLCDTCRIEAEVQLADAMFT